MSTPSARPGAPQLGPGAGARRYAGAWPRLRCPVAGTEMCGIAPQARRGTQTQQSSAMPPQPHVSHAAAPRGATAVQPPRSARPQRHRAQLSDAPRPARPRGPRAGVQQARLDGGAEARGEGGVQARAGQAGGQVAQRRARLGVVHDQVEQLRGRALVREDCTLPQPDRGGPQTRSDSCAAARRAASAAATAVRLRCAGRGRPARQGPPEPRL